MKLGISYWSIEGGLAGTLPIEEAMQKAKAAGFDGIELACSTTGVLNTQTDQATCEKYRKAGERIGIRENDGRGTGWVAAHFPDEATRKNRSASPMQQRGVLGAIRC
jgi:hypothetical protein